jgi:alkyl hydroperoxide reductase subunit AhpC
MSVLVQKQAPNFKAQAVVNGEFKEISLSDYKGKYVLLFFYPLDFTFVCPTEIIAFNDKLSEFKKRNTEVLGISVDSHFSHLAWINTLRRTGGLGKLDYPLVSDLSQQITKDYGIMAEGLTVSLRGLFLIDKQGIVRHQVVNDLPLGRNIEEAIRMVDALQFFEKNGEVCPANWKPGDKTIKPDVKGSKAYFESVHS